MDQEDEPRKDFLKAGVGRGDRIYLAAKAGQRDSEYWKEVWLMLPNGECQGALC